VERAQIINVKIGEMNVAKPPNILKTVLGSCVAFILYDKNAQVGGMAHIFFPENPGKEGEPLSKYANTAVPALVEEVIKHGGKKGRLIAHMVGGNRVFDPGTKGDIINVGNMNIKATQEAIKKERLLLMVAEVGKDHPVKVEFNLATGDLKIIPLKSI
jgi:chemotaxis protein CheD